MPTHTLTAPRTATHTDDAIAVQKRVLIADDNADAADAIAMLLELQGHTVVVASDGLDAVRKAEIHRPEVLLLDIGMPGLDGYETCRAIRTQAWATGARIVALTGWGDEEERRQSREAGFDLHLVKPVDPRVLDAILAS